MSEMNRERFEDLKESYILNALPENERREMEEYLVSHPDLQSEIDELGAIASLLAFSPPAQEPSPRLRKNLISTVRTESGNAGESHASERDPFSTRVREFFGFGRLALGAAALVVLVGLISWNVSLQNQNNDLQGKVQSVQKQAQQKQTQTYALKGSGTAQNVSGEVVKVNSKYTVLTADDLPSIPKDKTYQIWVIKNGVPKPAGVFNPNHGKAAAMVTISLKDGDTIAITVEPAGGSSKPTTDPIISTKV